MTRRRFILLAQAALGALATAAIATPIVGFLLAPLYEPRGRLVTRRLGPVSQLATDVPKRFVVDFPETGWTGRQDAYTVWVVKHADGLVQTFSNICTHMQCPVRYEQSIQQFECPCHGGFYNLHGVRVGGPPPKDLPEYLHTIVDGVVYISNQLNEVI